MENRFPPFVKTALFLVIAILLVVQAYPAGFAAGHDSLGSESGSSASYDSVYLDDIQKTIIPNRPKPIESFSKQKENGPEHVCLESPLAVTEHLSNDNVFIPCMRDRIRKLVPYKINGTNSKQPAPSF